MTTALKPVDAVLVGFGWTGAIMGQQLCDAGLDVVALERGPWRDTATDFATGFAQDELRYMWRHHLFQNVSYDTLTIRNNAGQEALPMRRLGAFLLGTGVGSGGVHWNGQIWRFLPSDFRTRSHNLERYGKQAIADYDLSVQDWGVTYEELEPHYDQFDRLCGTSGKAGNLNGKIQAGGNPFEGARSHEYPTPPMAQTYAPTLFGKAASELGRHPFPHPTGNLSQAYVNPLGAQLGACTYCGFCEKFGCGNYSKASPQTTVLPYLMAKPNFTLRTECEVLRVELSPDRSRATGVTYVNSAGEEFFQPAEMVILSAYVLQNVRLMLLSGIGKPYDPQTGEGVVGKNYAYQTMSSVNVFFDDKILNPFIGAGALATVIDDFNGDNFDHSGLGFIGGAYIAGMVTGGRVEARGREELPEIVFHQRPWLLHEPSRQLPRPGSDLSRCARAPDAAHDLRLHRQRAQDVRLPYRSCRRGCPGNEPARDQAQPARRLVQRGSLPDHAQHRRRDHGRTPER
jgi:gluconate 2-dehydrogenase alpha chain